MKKVIFIILLLVSIATLIFVYNDDFLYSDQIVKVTNINVLKEDVSQNALGLEEKYYKKEIKGTITNGKNKSKEKKIVYEEAYSSVVTDKYKVGDKLILSGSDVGLKRDFYVTLIVVIFLNLIL